MGEMEEEEERMMIRKDGECKDVKWVGKKEEK